MTGGEKCGILPYEVCALSRKKDYQGAMERELEALRREGRTPSLLLQDCCAPCGSYVIGLLARFFRVTVLFYNPNIYPESEYDKRLGEVGRLLALMETPHPVELMPCGYDDAAFAACAAGLEEEPEGGARCERCFRLRLERTARLAKENGFEYFATTLTVSPHKDPDVINGIGAELERAYGVRFLEAEFKKRDGYRQSIELSRKYDLYRQDYCGCAFSLRDRQLQKAEREKEDAI